MGVSRALRELAVPAVWWYRQAAGTKPEPQIAEPKPKRPHPRALSAEEKAAVLDTLYRPEFQDQSVPQAYAALLDRDQYLCSISSMYRILRENGQIHERRNQLRHPVYPVPILKATQPNQVWTWDITKLPGPYRGVFYFLYMVLDLFSRYVVRNVSMGSGHLKREFTVVLGCRTSLSRPIWAG